MPKLLTETQRKTLLANGAAQEAQDGHDFKPVVKLFLTGTGCTWLLTEINPSEPDIAFGLCDLGQGTPELGYVSLKEISGARNRLGLPVERDLYFEADKTLSQYADEARAAGRILA